ncbi:hypothetical protein HYPSUDRAFT_191754 [Hypholoma sublateritium FD-334 SS-4]|uniref:acylaminoacyl-peptidase n=1 Tax=Hypholoma sublateritium (strain FD-334 SS-4) TaxID=945553 RepID=A0A0D2NM73_HYPSF|nr:hypothetical protein HYPSUDRAFT_191754 [Hypholoma sublateritium FD-334 SS-4]
MSLYTQLEEIPVPVSAQFISPKVVQVTSLGKDHVTNAKRTMSKSIAFNQLKTTAGDLSGPGAPISSRLQDVDFVAQTTSLSGNKVATLRNVKGTGGDVKRVVEVWNLGLLEISLNVTDHHGDFYPDEIIGSLAFAPSEFSILYIAEGNAPESEDPYQKFRFSPDFGEGFVGKRRPAIFVLRWEAHTPDSSSDIHANLAQLETPDSIRFGQAIFSATSDEIIYATGYELTQDGRMLGVKGPLNHPVGIWQLRAPALADVAYKVEKKPTTVTLSFAWKLTPAHRSCRSPRILRTEGAAPTLLFLSSATDGPHASGSALEALDLADESNADAAPASQARTLIGTVEVPAENGFPGLYPANSLTKTFEIRAQGGKSPSILIGSQWGSRTSVLCVSLDSGSVQDLTGGQNGLYSWSLLATDGHRRAICTRSSPSVPPEIVLGTFDNAGNVSWTIIDKPALPEGLAKVLSAIRTSIIQIPGRPFLETIVVQKEDTQTSNAKPPCITYPHGGPHGTASIAFSAPTAALALEGYTISFPNYSGSLGYGEKFLLALLGRCGELDVQDCIASARHLIELGISEAGPRKQLIMGGSHGGFLTAHLIGQFPDFFTAAVLINPVISAAEIGGSDIPDWYFVEFNLGYPLASSPPGKYPPATSTPGLPINLPPRVDPAAFSALDAAMPLARVASMTVPVLILSSTADRRLAPTNSLALYHGLCAHYARPELRARGARVEMLTLEGEGHMMDGVEAARIWFESARDWFAEACKTEAA